MDNETIIKNVILSSEIEGNIFDDMFKKDLSDLANGIITSEQLRQKIFQELNSNVKL
ncbi:MAG: antitoxin VbhA family protein [Clostridia bacterium]